jgi:hypothetical protein
VTDITEKICELFKTTKVGSDGHVTLEEVVKLLERVDGALHGVVEEEPTNHHPQGVGGGFRHLNHGHQLGGDAVIQPRDDGAVDLQPLSVVEHHGGVDGAVDVVGDAKLAERGIEERAPGGEVRLGEVQCDGNMGADVHVLQRGSGDWLWRRRDEGV